MSPSIPAASAVDSINLSALEQRVRRAVKRQGQSFQKTRNAYRSEGRAGGEYYVLDEHGDIIKYLCDASELEEFARELEAGA